jgi:hypothetical protein
LGWCLLWLEDLAGILRTFGKTLCAFLCAWPAFPWVAQKNFLDLGPGYVPLPCLAKKKDQEGLPGYWKMAGLHPGFNSSISLCVLFA